MPLLVATRCFALLITADPVGSSTTVVKFSAHSLLSMVAPLLAYHHRCDHEQQATFCNRQLSTDEVHAHGTDDKLQ